MNKNILVNALRTAATLLSAGILTGCGNSASDSAPVSDSILVSAPVSSYVSPYPYDVVTVPGADNVVTVPDADDIARARNIILMIGDGMGLEHISCALVLNHGKLNMTSMPVTGLSLTTSADNLITDSAAGGTALASGQKTANGHVGVTPDGLPLESLLEKASASGRLTGVVTTCRLNDATPAAFCCHEPDRDDAESIVADYLDCGVDYIAGGGLRYWRDRSDGRDIISEMAARGYEVALSPEALAAADRLPVLGLLADLELPVALKRGDLYRDMVSHGLSLLSSSSSSSSASSAASSAVSESSASGFVMVLEGSCIDDWSHAGRLDLAMEELLDFDRTVGDVLEWAAADGHTLVVVTADHATGALTLRGGDLNEGRIEAVFGSDSHNGIAVPYFVYGPGSDRFGGVMENSALSALLASFL